MTLFNLHLVTDCCYLTFLRTSLNTKYHKVNKPLDIARKFINTNSTISNPTQFSLKGRKSFDPNKISPMPSKTLFKRSLLNFMKDREQIRDMIGNFANNFFICHFLNDREYKSIVCCNVTVYSNIWWRFGLAFASIIDVNIIVFKNSVRSLEIKNAIPRLRRDSLECIKEWCDCLRRAHCSDKWSLLLDFL
jgi:hypothetical protein